MIDWSGVGLSPAVLPRRSAECMIDFEERLEEGFEERLEEGEEGGRR
jgi:hypothetical protein